MLLFTLKKQFIPSLTKKPRENVHISSFATCSACNLGLLENYKNIHTIHSSSN